MGEMIKKITILGGGQWGRTIGLLLAQKEFHINIWDVRFTLKGELEKFFQDMQSSGYKLYSEFDFEANLTKALDNANVVFIALPSGVIRQVAQRMKTQGFNYCPLIIASKGVDESPTGIKLLSEVCSEELGDKLKIAVLSGPNLSKEIQAKHPAVTLIASKSKDLIQLGMNLLSSSFFRVYGSHDIAGVQIGGAVKNVIALAGGMVDELGYEYNTKAALLTRGLVEISRLGAKLGGEQETFAGISGLGDLICTAFSPTSRNYRAGRMFAQGMKRVQVENEIGEVIEGINTSRILKHLSERENVEMPISEGVYRVVWDAIEPTKVIEDLMTRKLKFE